MQPTRHNPGGAIACVLATLCAWSSVPLFLFYFSTSIDAWTSNGWRYAIAALFWLPFLLRARPDRRLFRDALVPSLINTCAQVCFTLAHYQISPGLVTFGLRIQIVCVALGAAICFPAERAAIRKPLFLLGLVMVLAGTLATAARDPEFGTRANTLGVALALAAGALFAAYGLSVRTRLARYDSITAFSAISLQTAGAMVALMLIFAHRAGLDALALSTRDLTLLVASAIIGIALGHVLFYVSMVRLGVAAASAVIQLQPFGTAIGATILFAEPLTGAQWIAGSVAVAGALLILFVQAQVNRRLRTRHEPAEPAHEPAAREPALAEAPSR